MVELVFGLAAGTIVGAIGVLVNKAAKPASKELTKEEKEQKELQDWGNRPILSDDTFLSLKKKLEDFLTLTDTKATYPYSLVTSVIDCGMRFSVKQIQTLRPIITHWCVYNGKEDKERANIFFISLVKETLTSKFEAKEEVLSLILDEKP